MNNAFILPLPVAAGIEMIDPATLIRIEAVSNYSKLFFTDGKTLVAAKVLRWFEERLRSESFLRIHRTHLVNKRFITRYAGGKVFLRPDAVIEVARRRKPAVLKSFLRPAA